MKIVIFLFFSLFLSPVFSLLFFIYDDNSCEIGISSASKKGVYWKTNYSTSVRSVWSILCHCSMHGLQDVTEKGGTIGMLLRPLLIYSANACFNDGIGK